jgi:hypothetical protein
MLEQSRNEKKLLAVERARFRLRQRLEAIDWEYDELKPLTAEYKAQAQLPAAPSEVLIDVEWDEPATEDPA